MNKKLQLQGWSKDQLIDEVARLRKRKKYGLVWEDKPEDVVEQCKTELPVLKEVKNKAIMKDKNGPVNILIEGDNYHALSVLNYTHKGKIDVIYIDPPYNTGNKDFKYNDAYVDRQDGYRHSKWLSFIEKRLIFAHRLIKKTGLIFISIDDNEQARLKLLCDEIFKEDNFIANLIWENREGGGSSDSKHFKIKHEYILVYAKNKDALALGKEEIPDEYAYTHTDQFESVRGKHKLIKLNSASIQYSKSLDYPINAPDKTKILPSYGKKRACWRWSKAKVEWGIKNKFIEIKKDRRGNWVVYSKQYLKVDNEGNLIERQRAPLGVISQFSSTMATKQLESIFHKKVFDYSKPYPLIQYLLKLSDNKNAIVLDFMAGSGTTGHAVLQLNKEDGGSRQFILCTNNENGIATDVCFTRIVKVIGGYRNAKDKKFVGIKGNLKYFRTAFVGADPNDKNKEALTKQAIEMLCMREDTFESVKETDTVKIFRNLKHYTGIVFDEDAIPAFKKDINKIGGVWSVYVFSLGDDLFEEEFEDMKEKITVAPIPEAILRVYRRLFKP